VIERTETVRTPQYKGDTLGRVSLRYHCRCKHCDDTFVVPSDLRLTYRTPDVDRCGLCYKHYRDGIEWQKEEFERIRKLRRGLLTLKCERCGDRPLYCDPYEPRGLRPQYCAPCQYIMWDYEWEHDREEAMR